MKYCLNTDNNACTYIIGIVNGFDSDSLTKITTHIAGTSYSCCWDGPGVSYGYSAVIIAVPWCIIVASCICTLLELFCFKKKVNLRKIQ